MKSFRVIALVAFAISAFAMSALAQSASTYTFAESAGVYTVLGGTNSTATGDDGSQNGNPIGFTFNLGGANYTHFCINTNGWIKLGNAATTVGSSPWVNSLSNTATHRPLIAALWDDNNRNTGAITFSTTGAPGSQVLTVDWNAISIGGGGATGGNASFQIKLYETTNVVEMIYGGTLAIDPGGLSASVGLNDMTSFLSVTPGAPGTASGAVANNAIAATTDIVSKMYTFTPPPPAPGTLALSAAAYANNENSTLVATVNRTAGSAGVVGATYTLADTGATGGAACTAGVDYINPGPSLLSFGDTVTSQPINVFLCPDAIVDLAETFTITLSAPTGGAGLGALTVATATINDAPPPLSGSYSIPGSYPSLTNAGGIFEALNLSGTSGNITINIAADLTGETGAVTLNPISGNPTVLIKPSGAPRTISGIAPIAVIRINGADNVRIDGSTAASFADNFVGGNPALRELTVQNLSTAINTGVIHIGSTTESSNGNSVRNVNVAGSLDTVVVTNPITLLGISTGGATPGTVALFANNNTVIDNCSARRLIIGIGSLGVTQATPNTGTVIARNDLFGTGTSRLKRFGIYIISDNGGLVTENLIGGIDNTGEGADVVGIGAGLQGISDSTTTTTAGVQNIMISRNRISGVRTDATFSSVGIIVAGVTGATNTLANNLISGVIGDGNLGDFPTGIFVTGVTGSTTRLFYNSVSMTGDRGALLTPATTMNPSFALAISGTDPIVELKNNIFYTTQFATGGGLDASSYAIGMTSAAFTNLDSDFNVFFSTGVNDGGFRSGSLDRAVDATTEVDYATVALWSTAIGGTAMGDDANSATIGEIDPMFFNPATDPHLMPASPARNVGTPTATGTLPTVDHDGNPRPNPADPLVVAVDIGGDEFLAPVSAEVTLGGRVMTAGGNGIRNAILTVSGGTLQTPIQVRTGSFGYYLVEGLDAGETYVITIHSKRYIFGVPNRVITATDSVNDIDFVADPQ